MSEPFDAFYTSDKFDGIFNKFSLKGCNLIDSSTFKIMSTPEYATNGDPNLKTNIFF